MLRRHFIVSAIAAMLLPVFIGAAFAQSDSLPSWNDGATKKAITDFVAKVTAQGGADFVPVDQRIATFDNDGTLWTEQPLYFQFIYTFDRVKQLAPLHSDWKTRQPFKSVIAGDLKAALATGDKGLVSLVGATSTGITTEESDAAVEGVDVAGDHGRPVRIADVGAPIPPADFGGILRDHELFTFGSHGNDGRMRATW